MKKSKEKGGQIPDFVGSIEESAIKRQAFELVFALDEVINLGFRENVTSSQVVTFTQMESQEERLFEIMERVCPFPFSLLFFI